MKNRLNIFANVMIKKFLIELLSKHELVFMNLSSIDYKILNTQANIIFINNNEDLDLVNFRKLNDNCLVISNLKNNNLGYNKNQKLLYSPLSIDYFKNTIDFFLQNLSIQFHDISIGNEKITNLIDNSFCNLTKIELDIFTYLIREKEVNKSFIREKILKIKSNIESNSLESHLTRIRKKMNKVNSNVKIQSKGEKLFITC